jgi:hypothetical protein
MLIFVDDIVLKTPRDRDSVERFASASSGSHVEENDRTVQTGRNSAAAGPNYPASAQAGGPTRLRTTIAMKTTARSAKGSRAG